MLKKKERKEKKSRKAIPGWSLNVPKLMPHLVDVKEAYGAQATPS